jgi:SAM-dependent methyltransferase
MSGQTVADFLTYWESEGEAYVRHGDYEWMASLVPGRRVLEIGCGLGFGTQALLARGLSVLAIDSLDECLQATAQRTAHPDLSLAKMDIAHLNAEQRTTIEQFAPDSVVCWLMGAPAAVTGAQLGDAGRAVASYREKIHRLVAELAASLPGVRYLHLLDRTAIPWQAKDIGRDTLVRYHAGKTLLDLPFTADRRHALYRKLAENVLEMAQIRKLNPDMKSVVPTLASLLAERKN